MKKAGITLAAILWLFVTIIFIREVVLLNVLSIAIAVGIGVALFWLEIICFLMMEKYPKKRSVVFG